MKIAFLINGSAKGLNKLTQDIQTTFKEYEPNIFLTEREGHNTELAQTAVTRGYDTIIICGGDGSLNEGINGIIQAFKTGVGDAHEAYNWSQISKIKVGVFPYGSGNDFSKTVQIPRELNDLKGLIQQQHTQLIDIGWASFFSAANELKHRFFINITDVGMGGETVLKLQNKFTRKLGADINYFWAITSTIATYTKVNVRAVGSNFTWEGKIMNFVVANGKYFGNGLGVAPEASVTDGQFEIVVVGDISLMDYLKNLKKIKESQKINHPEVHYFRTDSVQIESLEANNISIDMDGEFIGFAPMTLINLPQKIRFIC
ncbi:MAG: diacylglycerol kinase family protein [Chitinophagales bacterium]|nr:diacylglycerol kinase family lipid kinase [Chitinophagales bacterium]